MSCYDSPFTHLRSRFVRFEHKLGATSPSGKMRTFNVAAFALLSAHHQATFLIIESFAMDPLGAPSTGNMPNSSQLPVFPCGSKPGLEFSLFAAQCYTPKVG